MSKVITPQINNPTARTSNVAKFLSEDPAEKKVDEELEPLKRLNVEIPFKLHTELKKYVAGNKDIPTIRKFVEEALYKLAEEHGLYKKESDK